MPPPLAHLHPNVPIVFKRFIRNGERQNQSLRHYDTRRTIYCLRLLLSCQYLYTCRLAADPTVGAPAPVASRRRLLCARAALAVLHDGHIWFQYGGARRHKRQSRYYLHSFPELDIRISPPLHISSYITCHLFYQTRASR